MKQSREQGRQDQSCRWAFRGRHHCQNAGIGRLWPCSPPASFLCCPNVQGPRLPAPQPLYHCCRVSVAAAPHFSTVPGLSPKVDPRQEFPSHTGELTGDTEGEVCCWVLGRSRFTA